MSRQQMKDQAYASILAKVLALIAEDEILKFRERPGVREFRGLVCECHVVVDTADVSYNIENGNGDTVTGLTLHGVNHVMFQIDDDNDEWTSIGDLSLDNLLNIDEVLAVGAVTKISELEAKVADAEAKVNSLDVNATLKTAEDSLLLLHTWILAKLNAVCQGPDFERGLDGPRLPLVTMRNICDDFSCNVADTSPECIKECMDDYDWQVVDDNIELTSRFWVRGDGDREVKTEDDHWVAAFDPDDQEFVLFDCNGNGDITTVGIEKLDMAALKGLIAVIGQGFENMEDRLSADSTRGTRRKKR